MQILMKENLIVIIATAAMFARVFAGNAEDSSEEPDDLSAFVRKSNVQLESRMFYEGDMRFAARVDDAEQDDLGTQHDGNAGGTGLRSNDERWRKKNGYVTVPYVIDQNARYTKFQTDNIKYAMRLIEYETGCIRFRRRKKERDFIWFTMQESGCWSYVGRVGGRQVVNLDQFCAEEHGVALHEIIHALGFYHMHSHTQRDHFIQIKFENIYMSDRHNFHKITPKEGASFGTKYDYLSIMHYGPYYFSANGRMTIVPHNPKYMRHIGQRNKMSPGDIERIRNMYQCVSSEEESEQSEEYSDEEEDAGNQADSGEVADEEYVAESTEEQDEELTSW